MSFEREQHIAELVAKYVTGAITQVEAEELEVWRNEREANGAMLDRMLSRTEFEKNVERFCKPDDDRWRVAENRGPGMGHRRRMLVRFAVAVAAVTALFVAGYYMIMERPLDNIEVVAENGIVRAESAPVLILGDGRQVELTSQASDDLLHGESLSLDKENMSLVYGGDADAVIPATHTLLVPKGSNHRVVLHDGTAVLLNAGSSLVYPSSFTGPQRRVQLLGEAYFDVAEDGAHPFVVEVGEVEVTVTGTTFGVRAYGDEPVVRTVLESGSVDVHGGALTLSMLPDMQAQFDRHTGAIFVQSADVEMLLAWKNGRFAYDGSTLEDIFDDLGRWYDFEVVWADDHSRGLRYSLDIRKHAGFDSILDIIRATRKVDFEVAGNVVTVSSVGD